MSFISLLKKRLQVGMGEKIRGIRPIYTNYEIAEFIDMALDLIGRKDPEYTLFENHRGIHIDQMIIDFAEGLGFDAGDCKRTPGDMYVVEEEAIEIADDAIRFLNDYFVKEGCEFMYHPELGCFGHYYVEKEYYLTLVASSEDKALSYNELQDAFSRYCRYCTITLNGKLEIEKDTHIIPIKMVTGEKEKGFSDIATIMGTIGYKNVLIHMNTDE